LNLPVQIPEGGYKITVMPRPEEYYDRGMRVRREIDIWSLPRHYTRTPYGSFQQRRQEALVHAAKIGNGLYSEIAKIALDRWDDVREETLMDAVARVNRREDGSVSDLMGLLGLLCRHGEHPAFPAALKGPLQAAAWDYRYWWDEPGDDVMDFWSESEQILYHACEILAGQLFPDATFSNTGRSGEWHRDKGSQLALAWMRNRGTGGFRAWNASLSFERVLLALSHMVDLAQNREVWELAAILMDKLFFGIALNSHRGVFGAAQGRAVSSVVKGGFLDPVAGISQLMWGTGIFNQHASGLVGVATAQEYELPVILQQIALDAPQELLNTEHHGGRYEPDLDGLEGAWEANIVTYKTPDYMLSSVQDHRAGEKGAQEHIWQATLSPGAVVFVNHPARTSQLDARQPGFWAGNGVLPRVTQWRDTLLALYQLPESEWMDYTHAYFPLYAFDEHALRDGWAFGRVGEGYVALTASQGFSLVEQGESAYRELRSPGRRNVWVCQMGRAALDRGFRRFQQRVLGLDLTVDGLSVRFQNLRASTLVFDWHGPLLVNGEAQSVADAKHYANPYCQAEYPARHMDIIFGDQGMRLDFGSSHQA
jgi:hypothetical protein